MSVEDHANKIIETNNLMKKVDGSILTCANINM